MVSTHNLSPIIKWAGGKRSLAPRIVDLLQVDDSHFYYEPFLGGAAVLLYMAPKNAICFDVNEELVVLYNTVKDNPEEVIRILKMEHYKRHSSDYYYMIRNLDRDKDSFRKLSNEERAARFLYLNRACFNGLWRENSKGENNVPEGKYKKLGDISNENILALSKYLNNNNISILHNDYLKVEELVKKGDVVYFDPPYDIEVGQNGFVSYSKSGFNQSNQVDLKYLCDRLVKKGVTVGISNSRTQFIQALYSEGPIEYQLYDDIIATRSIGSTISTRKKISELLIIGRP